MAKIGDSSFYDTTFPSRPEPADKEVISPEAFSSLLSQVPVCLAVLKVDSARQRFFTRFLILKFSQALRSLD